MATATKTIVKYRRKSGKRHHRRAKQGISLAILAGFAPTALFAWQGYQDQGIGEVPHRLIGRLVGYDINVHKFSLDELAKGWIPIIGGALAHKMANRLGINRVVRRATMGFISI
jgi:hypothetical protein